ncbi:Protein ASPARTIC PROTEASE IN GUARD CELL 2 [Frankliniella fusca]|uniref:Protein ASPARTIC PROTEASE IN GUARD CELL 2 n=1 Tax=Frankliniella fusca TaxID=407009 RepID=A0AAE1HZ27_9NEOP|nr:Protein ASPARTIC PROTEASE IN GUARD CELL 2 [Frankliniella fusca]
MSYTELEHGYQGLKKARPAFYFGDSSVRPVSHRDILKPIDSQATICYHFLVKLYKKLIRPIIYQSHGSLELVERVVAFEKMEKQ